MKLRLTSLSLLLLSTSAFAATSVDLAHKPASFLTQPNRLTTGFEMQELKRNKDFNNTMHIRLKQKYQGYEVVGGDAMMHVPNAGLTNQAFNTMQAKDSFLNGKVYEGLQADLANTPALVFSAAQKTKAIAKVIEIYKAKRPEIREFINQSSQLMVFVDPAKKAHWVYLVKFDVAGANNRLPEKQNYIVDSIDFSVYENWNDIKTESKKAVLVKGGGFGGNHKTLQKTFDDLPGNLPAFDVLRTSDNHCLMTDKKLNFSLRDDRTNKTMYYKCVEKDPKHNNIYWSGDFDKVKTTWSPANDVMFGTRVTIKMFQDWYNIPVLQKSDGKPYFLLAVVHDSIENAYWDSVKVVFGNSVGSSIFNPFTSLDTVAHEINHGFTEFNSGLVYSGQSGGLNEAYSDMAGIAAEYYAYGKTTYLVGWGDRLQKDKALRYMDKPSRDCEKGEKPGVSCSIDHMDQYKSGMEVHYTSGIFNRVYYNLANTPGWNAKTAFDVMVQANRYYWTPRTTYAEAACGVMKSAQDYKYNLEDVKNALNVVGLDGSAC